MKLRIIIAFMALVLAALPALVAAPSVPVAAAPPAQWGDMSLIGPYNVTLSGMSGAAGGVTGEIQTTIDNFQFDFPIVGMVHHRVSNSGGNLTDYKMGVYSNEPPIPALDGRWVPDTNGRRIYFDEWRCYSGGIALSTSSFSQTAVCNEARSLLGLPSGWSANTSDNVYIDAGYPFSIVFSMGCRNSSGGPAPCSVTLQYWFVAVGASAGSGGDGQPACPAGDFETDGLTIEWMSACYHCLPEIAPLPTTEPQPTVDPEITPEPTAFLPTPEPIGSPTPQASPTPDPAAPFDQWHYVEGVLETASFGVHEISSPIVFPVQGYVIEAMTYPPAIAFDLEVYPPGEAFLEIQKDRHYRTVTGRPSAKNLAVEQLPPKVAVIQSNTTNLNYGFEMGGVQPLTIVLSLCPEDVCKVYYRIWFLSNVPPLVPAPPLSTPWDVSGVSNGGSGPSGLSCSVPEYVDDIAGNDGGGVDVGLIDWELNLREGACMTIVPGIDEEVAGQALTTPAVSLCPTYIDLPEVEILEFQIPIFAIFVLPIGMFLVNWLRTL